MLRWHAEHLDYSAQLILLVSTGEQRLTGVHLDQNTAQTPHVDGQIVRYAKQHFRRPIEATLDVFEELLL